MSQKKSIYKELFISRTHTRLIDSCILFLSLILFLANVKAQEPELRFKSLDMDLSDHGIRAIIEDHKGYMWFGGESGLNRFDGVNMNIYTREPGDSKSLSSNSVVTFCETKSNELWIGTSFGLNLYDRQQDNFIQYFFNGTQEDYDYNFIHKIIEDDIGNIWVATLGGLCLVDRDKKKYIKFKSADTQKDTLNRLVNALIQDKEGRILCSTDNGNILQLDQQTGGITTYSYDNGNVNNAKRIIATNFIQSYDGLIWATSTNMGLIKIKRIEDGHIWYDQIIPQKVNVNSQNHVFVSGMCEYDTNIILFSTENGGLNTYNYQTGTFTNYIKGAQVNNNTIGGNSVWTIYKDKKGLIWLGIFNVGVNVIDNRATKFTSYRHNQFESQSLTHGAISSFAEDEKGNVWITSDGGGLDYWDREKGIFIHHRHATDNSAGILSDAGLCLHYSSLEELWVGFYNGGISIIQPDKSIRNLTSADGLSSNNVFSIAERRNGNIYIATYNGGLDVYNPKTKQIKGYANESFAYSSFRNMQINLLYVDSKDRLWLGFNNGGLFLMTENADGSVRFKNYRYNSNERVITGDNTVLCIHEDKNGFLWIGSRDGLHKFNVEDETFKLYRMEDGLPSNTVVGILEDDNGVLWISSLNGLTQFNPILEVFKSYNIDDGIQGQKFSNRNAVYKNTRGEMFFGGNSGFTIFNPAELKYETSFAPVYLTDFKLFNQSAQIGVGDSPLKKHISESQKLKLKHGQSVFTIEYVALNYLSAEKIRYAYMLEGLEDAWNYVGGRRSATYTNLDAGTYVFKVKSTNAEGNWNPEFFSLIIEVTPPWWETLWFRLFALLALGMVLYVIYNVKTRRINQQKLLLQQTVNTRTQELYEKNAELEEINEEVIQQKEELMSQAEVLEQTNRQLEIKTNELSSHKTSLESVVEERTSQLEKEKERAEESDRLKSAFLANMSHEIRTPLNAIVGFSHLLDEPDLTKDEQKEYIESIDANTASLLKLIDDILDLSMIESNQVHIDNSEINVERLLDEVFSNGVVLNKNVKLRIEKPEGLSQVMVRSDFVRIKQILFNLFNNACKFTEKGFVELGCRFGDKEIAFYVKDTGIGISKENLDVVFNRFRKITDEKTKLFRGAGLGLAISKKLADLLKGELYVESELGKGTTFTFIMPAFKRSTPQEVKKVKASYKTGISWEDHSMLIVEDEKTNFDYLRSALKSTKINITWARNGKEAVDLFTNRMKYDIVLMDIKMPEMNGYDATLAIKAIAPDQVIIAQTAYARPDDIKEITNAGFDAYLVKPIIPKGLIELLRKKLK